MNRDKWVWLPHAGHCIVGNMCEFHLSTYVGKYLVSTIGEYWPDRAVRIIHARVKDNKWFKENKGLIGDDFNVAYFKRFGWIEIGSGRIYETMVFKAKKSKEPCCPWVILNGENIDFNGYNKPEDARKGHIKMCKKWSKK